MVEQFHIGQRVRLKRTLATNLKGLFRKGETGTVTGTVTHLATKGILFLIKMDQYFPHLNSATLGTSDNTLTLQPWEITARPIGQWTRLRAARRGEREPKWMSRGQWREHYAQCDGGTRQLADVILQTLAGYRQNATFRGEDRLNLITALDIVFEEGWASRRHHEHEQQADKQ